MKRKPCLIPCDRIDGCAHFIVYHNTQLSHRFYLLFIIPVTALGADISSPIFISAAIAADRLMTLTRQIGEASGIGLFLKITHKGIQYLSKRLKLAAQNGIGEL